MRKVINELRENPRIQVHADEPGELATEFGDAQSVFRIISDRYDMPLDPSLQRCFIRFDEFSSHWRFEEDDVTLTGEFRLSYLLAALATPPPPLASKSSSEFERQLYTEFRVIDDRPGSGTGALSALRLLPGVTVPEIWYHDLRRGVFKMDINYCEYLDALTVTKGVSSWQCLFADISLAGDDFISIASNLKDMLETFPELFPEYDYDPLRERLRERL
ncbi:hypothetical protein [Actinomadura sp. 9N215]|uniref:hypothetical protein n=1 Tax=Actinomadura sp. 9N215 TaxID=3375150 RepID=UPI0037B8231B